MRTHDPYRQPNGRRWMALRRQVFRAYGTVCWICGHDGARQVDHIIPVSVDPRLGWVLENLRPAHGNMGARCPTCGRACNQGRGNRMPKPRPAEPPQTEMPKRPTSRPW